MPKNGLVEIEAVAQIGVQTAGSVLDMNKADSQLWTKYYCNFIISIVLLKHSIHHLVLICLLYNFYHIQNHNVW